MKVSWNGHTDTGLVRDHNEDSFGARDDADVEQQGLLLVVCDGMGGHAAGEVASQMAVKTILDTFYGDDQEDRSLALQDAFIRANDSIHRHGRGKMGTTGVAALLHHDALVIANVGDSRAYLLRNGQIWQISRDHSFVNDQVEAGLLTPEEARVSPIRNVITRALGHQPDVAVDLFRRPVQVGDIILLSSDGMHGMLEDSEILAILQRHPAPRAIEELIDLANARGGPDNITVLLAQVEQLDWEVTPLDDESSTRATSPDADTTPITRLTPLSNAALPEAPPVSSLPTRRITSNALRPIHTSVLQTETSAPTPAKGIATLLRNPPTNNEYRHLNLLGSLLATLVLMVLGFMIVWTLNTPNPALQPLSLPLDPIRPTQIMVQ
jgi:protein phosphatase